MHTKNEMNSALMLSLSVVSHGQSDLIIQLLSDLEALPLQNFEVIVTSNLPEDTTVYGGHRYPVQLIANQKPKGFGSNHNAAFAASKGRFFAIVNPDIRCPQLDMGVLLRQFDDAHVGAVAPVILSPNGGIEDSVRRFPTVARLLRRKLTRRRKPDYVWLDQPIEVDWVAGMFVLFRPQAFKELNGFDDRRFFMYMEDVDICERLWHHGWSVHLQPATSVIHAAQRASHRNAKHLRWHLVSAMRYLTGL
jgi:N-acetylglucosaminyl-diphospho-decaprenol L-rhamnosyltransferase